MPLEALSHIHLIASEALLEYWSFSSSHVQTYGFDLPCANAETYILKIFCNFNICRKRTKEGYSDSFYLFWRVFSKSLHSPTYSFKRSLSNYLFEVSGVPHHVCWFPLVM